MSSPNPTPSSMDADILRRLSQMRIIFYRAVKTGKAELELFLDTFDEFLAKASLAVREETHLEVSSFVNAVRGVSDSTLDLESISDIVHDSFDEDLKRISTTDFKRLSLDDPVPIPPYIEPCYTWLLSHLHNPYPVRTERERLSRESGAPSKHIDAWFVNARNRIGWNRIRRRYFANRADMVKAARRYFRQLGPRTVVPDSSSQLANQDYASEFAGMQADALALYADKLFPTQLATEIEMSVDSSRPANASSTSSHAQLEISALEQDSDNAVPSTEVPKKRRNVDSEPHAAPPLDQSERPRSTKRRRHEQPTKSDVAFASPSSSPVHGPFSGPHASPSPAASSSSLFGSSPEAINTALPPSDQRKRRGKDAMEYDSDSSQVVRTRRRRRLEDVTPEGQDTHCLGGDNIESVASGSLSTPVPGSSSHIPSTKRSAKRKRRLSENDTTRSRKRPHHPGLSAPRLQTVSNPSPLPTLLNDAVQAVITSGHSRDATDVAESNEYPPFNTEAFDYGNMSMVNDYLSQLESASSNLDNKLISSISSSSQSVQPTHLPLSVSQGSASQTNAFPLFDFDFTASNNLSTPPYEGPFSGISSASRDVSLSSQALPSTMTSDTFAAVDQTFNAVLGINPSTVMAQVAGVNPMDLLLSSYTVPAAPQINPVVVTNAPSASSATTSSQTHFAFHEIQRLQAELDMVKNQLALHGIHPA